jgi:hypothetical protein
MTLAASNTPGRYEPLGANAPIKSFTGEACKLGFTTLRFVPTCTASRGAAYPLASRRASSASTASRMKSPRLFGRPITASIRAMTASESRTVVSFTPSAGRPMRGVVTDSDKSDKPIVLMLTDVSDSCYITDIAYGDKQMQTPIDHEGLQRRFNAVIYARVNNNYRDEPIAESRLLDLCIASGMDPDEPDHIGWTAIKLGDWLSTGEA